MTDAPAPRRLAELYRASMAQSPAADAEALLSALEGRGGRDIRDQVLSLAAAHPAQSALLQTLASLRCDVDDLQREVRALRRPVPQRQPVWAALAACCALAAVVAFGLRPGFEPATGDDILAQDSLVDTDRISSVSFESASDTAADAGLFRGSFDS